MMAAGRIGRIIKAMTGIVTMLLMVCFICGDIRAEVVVSPEGIEFDTEYYAAQNPEIAEAYGNTFDGLYRHYLEHGKFEGRYPNPAEAAQNHADSTSSNRVNNNPNAEVIIIGDSRVYLIHQIMGDDIANWFGYSGTGIRTLCDEISPQIDNLVLEGKKIVIMYGINDLSPFGSPEAVYNAYNDFFSKKAQQWIQRGAKVYFVDLIGIGHGPDVYGAERSAEAIKVVNDQVALFNQLIRSLPGNIGHISVKAGLDSFYDGIHFKPEIDREIYQQILQQIK